MTEIGAPHEWTLRKILRALDSPLAGTVCADCIVNNDDVKV